ncbi:hypothetical protein [Rhodopila globiformis]|uniref:Uncharacterized protein n=1 Tax=Rhodopila globiformis TaxID=1071 RepID=A0A2S6MWY5_RHOGL|nr:hypothetical protein [Rhodopila globiformis]PPQ26875.1 hypothetical protein CCS01_28770 [Rhodopila globiformis]
MMSLHDALEAWQAGEITAAHAMRLTGAANVLKLLAFAHKSRVEIRPGLLPREEEQARRATELIVRLLQQTGGTYGRASTQVSSAK